MNRLEFNEVLKAFNTDGYLNDISMHFGGTFYTVIKGKVPLEVANIIYTKYPNNPYKIRVAGGCEYNVPAEWAVDDKYKKELEVNLISGLDSKEYLKRLKRSRKNLLRRTIENRYIETYHIDSKEGLVILLTELQDYYARKKGVPETEVQRYDEIMATINAEILKKVNPGISIYDWMSADAKHGKMFLDTVARDNKTRSGQDFRRIIEQFDKTINPYMNKDIELDSISNYQQKVNIRANVYDNTEGEYRNNCCYMTIVKSESEGAVKYRRNSDGFSCHLVYNLGSGDYLNVSHYFKNSEYICIDYFGQNFKQKNEIRYDINQRAVLEENGLAVEATFEQLDYIYNELVKATELASTITINNMKKDNYSKKLVFDKK
mgnify:FL=1